jgi:hypothetical protein
VGYWVRWGQHCARPLQRVVRRRLKRPTIPSGATPPRSSERVPPHPTDAPRCLPYQTTFPTASGPPHRRRRSQSCHTRATAARLSRTVPARGVRLAQRPHPLLQLSVRAPFCVRLTHNSTASPILHPTDIPAITAAYRPSTPITSTGLPHTRSTTIQLLHTTAGSHPHKRLRPPFCELGISDIAAWDAKTRHYDPAATTPTRRQARGTTPNTAKNSAPQIPSQTSSTCANTALSSADGSGNTAASAASGSAPGSRPASPT